MNPDPANGRSFGRRLLDGALFLLLLLALAGVYSWDSRHQERHVVSAASSPGLLSTAPSRAPAPRPKKPAARPKAEPSAPAKESGTSQADTKPAPSTTPDQQSEPGGGQAAKPVQPRYTLQAPRLAEPEPPPVVVQKLLTQPDLNQFGNPEGEGYG